MRNVNHRKRVRVAGDAGFRRSQFIGYLLARGGELLSYPHQSECWP